MSTRFRIAATATLIVLLGLAVLGHARAASPIVAADSVTTAINKTVEFDVLKNDPQSAVLVDHTEPASGLLTIQTNGRLRYLPNANFTGADGFTYRAQMITGEIQTATVSITVTGEVTAVEARNDSLVTDEDTPVQIAVLGNDAGVPGGAPLVVTIDAPPQNGTAEIGADGSVRYSPAANWSGEDEFTYVTTDGATSDSAKVRIAVNPVPDPPDAVDDRVRMGQDGSTAIDVLANDSEIEGDPFSLSTFTPPAHGTAAWSDADRMIIYSPATGFWGEDQFTYTIADGDGIDTAVVSISVDGAPVAQDDTGTTSESSPVSLAVLANDSDPESGPLVVSNVSLPGHGSVVVNPDMTIGYEPAPGFSGDDSFTYSVSDQRSNISTARVAITVTPRQSTGAFSAQDDEFLVLEDSPGNTIDLLSNDDLAEGAAPVLSVDSAPAHGSVTIDALQIVTYVPAAEYYGSDSFTYSVVDGVNRATATVVIEVQAVNDLPLAQPDEVSILEDTTIEINAIANDTDIDLDQLSVESVAAPEHGKARVNDNGAIDYTPARDYVGADALAYTVSDGHGGTASATVTVAISAVDDPPHAGNDRAQAEIGAQISIDVLGNDADPDSAVGNLEIVKQPRHGDASITPTNSITYTPDAGYEGVDSLTYQISDGDASDTATIRITVGHPKSRPTARDDQVFTRAGEPVVIDPSANDSDSSGESLTVSGVTKPNHGSVSVDDNDLTYTPNPEYVGQDSFDYTVENESGAADKATVVVEIESPKAQHKNK